MMNHDFEIPLERRDYHLLGNRPQAGFKKMRAPDSTFADDDSLRVQQIHQVCDTESEIAPHLLENPRHRFVTGFRPGDDGLDQGGSLMIIERSFREAKTCFRGVMKDRRGGSMRFHAAACSTLAERPVKDEFGVTDLGSQSLGTSI